MNCIKDENEEKKVVIQKSMVFLESAHEVNLALFLDTKPGGNVDMYWKRNDKK